MTLLAYTMAQFGNLLPYGMGNDDECHPLDEINEDPVTEDDMRRFKEEEEALDRRLDGRPTLEEEYLLAELVIDHLVDSSL